MYTEFQHLSGKLRNYLCNLGMAALCNRAGHYIFLPYGFFFYLLSFSSPNLSRRRLDVYHTTLPHMVWP